MTISEIERRNADYDAYSRMMAGGPGCAPWCAYHDPEYPVCWSHPDGPGGYDVALTREPEPWGYRLHWAARAVVSLDDAEAFARHILTLVAMAKGAARQ